MTGFRAEVDFTNGSIRIVDATGRIEAAFAPGCTRTTADAVLAPHGWTLVDDTPWTLLPVPDGFSRPVRAGGAHGRDACHAT